MFPTSIVGTTARLFGSAMFVLLPRQKAITMERCCRGLEESLKIKSSNVVVTSFGKSGRTWLRVMLSRFFQSRFLLPDRMLIDHANFHNINRSIPVLFFTHDNYAKDYLGAEKTKEAYAGRKIIFLVRDPIDVIASQYFQWKYRMKSKKKIINKYPKDSAEITISDFATGDEYGIPKLIRFYNDWIETAQTGSNVIVIRYESLRLETARMLETILGFMGFQPTSAEIAECVAFGSFDSMRELELQGHFADNAGRMKASDPTNPDSFKVRRASARGNRDYFAQEDLAVLEAYVARHLRPGFGYGDSKQLLPNVY